MLEKDFDSFNQEPYECFQAMIHYWNRLNLTKRFLVLLATQL